MVANAIDHQITEVIKYPYYVVPIVYVVLILKYNRVTLIYIVDRNNIQRK